MVIDPDELSLIIFLDNTLRSFSELRLDRAPFMDRILQRLLVKFNLYLLTTQECRTLCL